MDQVKTTKYEYIWELGFKKMNEKIQIAGK